MKTILFFALAGSLSAEMQAARTAMQAKWPGARVVPRNASVSGLSKDTVELCDAVTGDPIPAPYRDRYPVVDMKSLELSEDPRTAPKRSTAALSLVPTGGATQEDLDPAKTGLGEGLPQTRDELKAALKDAGVPFHGSLGTPKLVELFRAEVLKENPEEPETPETPPAPEGTPDENTPPQ